MAVFPSVEGEPTLEKVFQRFPHTLAPLLEYHDRLLRDPSPLTVAQRELIAAYVSGLNACTYCHGAHVIAAQAFGIDGDLFEGLMADPETSAVEERLKPILAYVRKLTLTPSMMSEADAIPVYEAGWEEQALFDAVSVCALFNFMNRIIEGCGIKSDPLESDPAEFEARKKRMGGNPTIRTARSAATPGWLSFGALPRTEMYALPTKRAQLEPQVSRIRPRASNCTVRRNAPAGSKRLIGYPRRAGHVVLHCRVQASECSKGRYRRKADVCGS